MPTNSEQEEFEFRLRAEQEASQQRGRRTPKEMKAEEPSFGEKVKGLGEAALTLSLIHISEPTRPY